MSVIGVIGILLFFVGAHLLWQARGEILYWAVRFFWILRDEFTRRGGLEKEETRGSEHPQENIPIPAAAFSVAPGRPFKLVVRPAEPRHWGTLRLLGGFALMFLGPLLLLLDLVF